MQDAYVGDIGDYGKYALLRAVTAKGLRLAVNWYRTEPKQMGKQDDGKYTDYLKDPAKWRSFDPKLYDALRDIVSKDRSLEAVERSGMLPALYFCEKIQAFCLTVLPSAFSPSGQKVRPEGDCSILLDRFRFAVVSCRP